MHTRVPYAFLLIMCNRLAGEKWFVAMTTIFPSMKEQCWCRTNSNSECCINNNLACLLFLIHSNCTCTDWITEKGMYKTMSTSFNAITIRNFYIMPTLTHRNFSPYIGDFLFNAHPPYIGKFLFNAHPPSISAFLFNALYQVLKKQPAYHNTTKWVASLQILTIGGHFPRRGEGNKGGRESGFTLVCSLPHSLLWVCRGWGRERHLFLCSCQHQLDEVGGASGHFKDVKCQSID